MDLRALGALIGFAVQVAAGAAPVRWPQYTWLADLIFWGACAFAEICLLWWFFSNYPFKRAYLSRAAFASSGRKKVGAWLLAISIVLLGSGAIIGLVALWWLYEASSATAKAPPEQEKVRDQLKFVNPVFKRDFIQRDDKKFIEKAQLAIVLRNDALVSVSYTIQDFKSVIEGHDAPVTPGMYPNKGITLQPGQTVTFGGVITPLERVECNLVRGEMHFDVRYGVPGFEDFSLKGGMRFKIRFDPANCEIKEQEWNWITGALGPADPALPERHFGQEKNSSSPTLDYKSALDAALIANPERIKGSPVYIRLRYNFDPKAGYLSPIDRIEEGKQELQKLYEKARDKDFESYLIAGHLAEWLRENARFCYASSTKFFDVLSFIETRMKELHGIFHGGQGKDGAHG